MELKVVVFLCSKGNQNSNSGMKSFEKSTLIEKEMRQLEKIRLKQVVIW